MNAQHTPGRLKVQHPHAGERGWEIAFELGVEQVCQDITEANARRLVACWNYCEGVSTEHLEKYGMPDFAQKISDLREQRNKLLEALKRIEGATMSMYATRSDMLEDCQDIALAAIAKAGGEA